MGIFPASFLKVQLVSITRIGVCVCVKKVAAEEIIKIKTNFLIPNYKYKTTCFIIKCFFIFLSLYRKYCQLYNTDAIIYYFCLTYVYTKTYVMFFFCEI